MTQTSPAKRMVTGLRYLNPVIPVFAFAMAESVPRLWRRLVGGWGRSRRSRLDLAASALLASWIVGVALASVVVHWTFDRWSATQGEITDNIQQVVGNEAVLVTNWWQTRKFIREWDRPYALVHRSAASLEDLARLTQRHDEFYLAFLDRSDSEYHRKDVVMNAAFVAALKPAPELLLDRRVTSTDRLRIWRVTEVCYEPCDPREAGGLLQRH